MMDWPAIVAVVGLFYILFVAGALRLSGIADERAAAELRQAHRDALRAIELGDNYLPQQLRRNRPDGPKILPFHALENTRGE